MTSVEALHTDIFKASIPVPSSLAETGRYINSVDEWMDGWMDGGMDGLVDG